MSIQEKLALALIDLRTTNFAHYLQTLAALGIDISQELQLPSLKALSQAEAVHKSIPHLTPLKPQPQIHYQAAELQQMVLHAELFAKIWSRPVDANQESLKKNLTTTSRHQIHLSLLAIKQYLEALQRANPPNDQAIDANPLLDLKHLQEHEANIVRAIQNYQTTRQKIVRGFANTLVIATSLIFGMVQTSVAIFFVGVLLFSPVGIGALSGVLVGALVSGAIYSYINYCTQKDDIPYILNEIAGRDRFLQGFLSFKNKDGKEVPLSRKQQAALGLYTLGLAIPAAAAAGAFGFTSAMSIPALVALFGVTLAASFITPIAVVIAAIITINMTLFMLRAFHNFIAYDQGNLLTFIRRPFDEVADLINQKIDPQLQPKLNKGAKIGALVLCGAFCAMSMIGLAVTSLAGVNSMSALMNKLFQTPTIVNASVGIVVGGIISFASKAFFTLKKGGNAIVNLFKVICHQSKQTVNKIGLFTGFFVNLPLSAFFWMDSFIRPPATVPVMPMPHDIKTAALATSCTTIKDIGIVVNSMFDEKKAAETLPKMDQDSASFFTDELAQKHSFVKIPTGLNNYSLFKSLSLDPSAEITPSIEEQAAPSSTPGT